LLFGLFYRGESFLDEWIEMQEFLHFFGHGFCHQIPARSFEAGGLVFSACSRDTGIYLGFFFTVVVGFVMYARSQEKPAELPHAAYLVILALFIVPMAFDGLSSYAGIRPTTNTIRYITGFLTGTAAGTIVTPLLFAIHSKAVSTKRFLAKPSLIAIHLVASFVLGALFFISYPYLGIISPFFSVAAFLCIVISVNVVLVTLIKPLPTPHKARYWLLLLGVCLVLSLIEITLFGLARELIVQTLLQGHELSEFLS
jgi:uncharacterized membrane protein